MPTETGHEDAVEHPVGQQPREARDQGRAGDPTAVHAAVRAGERAMDEFLAIVGDLVGTQHARRFAALLLASAHGITDLQVSGHLSVDKWHVSVEDLVPTLVSVIDSQVRSE
ncbi:hypothetical protein [Amycolatopsis pigmentata]|uniref:Tetracyclin repressor-like C-terminal domain-containing protein n=1 Tax=Amycolatopsis pigmentata TaxID=450801 RepID=A0ABW5FSH4_9PSEU